MSIDKDTLRRLDALDRDASRALRALAGEDASRATLADVLKRIITGESKSDVSPEQARKLLESLVGEKDARRLIEGGKGAGGDEDPDPDSKARAEADYIQSRMTGASPSPGVRRVGVGGCVLELGSMTPAQARADLEADARSRSER